MKRNAPIRLILTGATGFVGGEVLRQALDCPEVERVTVLTRRPVELAHPKLLQVIVEDFTDFSQIDADALTADACIWCLGVSQTAATKTPTSALPMTTRLLRRERCWR